MKDTTFTNVVDDVIALKMKAADEWIEAVVEPLLDSLGNPEKLIGVPWERWTDQHKQILYRIYGETLKEFIAKKAIAQMRELEAEVM